MLIFRALFFLLLGICGLTFHFMELGSASHIRGVVLPFFFATTFLIVLLTLIGWLIGRVRRLLRYGGTRGGSYGSDSDISWGEFGGGENSGFSSCEGGGAGDCGGGGGD
jgi:hypothetical protein